MLLVSPLAFVACSGPTSDVEILLIGDSITEGFISGSEGLTRSCVEKRCWAAQLAARLGQGYRVIERGVGGATTLDWVSPTVGIPFTEFETSQVSLFDGLAARDLPASIVVILLGANDAVGFGEDAPLRPDEYARNLELLTRRLLDYGVGQVVLLPPTPHHAAPPRVRVRLFEYRFAIERLCRAMSEEGSTKPSAVICGPNLLDLLGPEHFEKNDVHPNASGHRRIAEAVAETIEALSRDRVPESDSLRTPVRSFDSGNSSESSESSETRE